MTNQQQILEIVSSCSISDSNQICFNKSNIFEEYLFSKNFFYIRQKTIESLSHLIYENFYIKKYINQATNLDDFIEKVNKFKPKYTKINGWALEHLNVDGSIIASKKNKRKYVKNGFYFYDLNEEDFNKKVVLIQPLISLNSSFVNFFSKEIADSFNEFLIRFYFNINTDGALKFINFLLRVLKQNNTPFNFKCLKNPNDYTRADSAVLYLDKRYFFKFKPILKELIEEVKPYLNPETPLFTLKLYNGIGFAENPFDPNESFGMSRCRLIAEGIWSAHDSKLLKEQWTNHVIAYIESKGYNLEKFYLNPNSRFPYDFSL